MENDMQGQNKQGNDNPQEDIYSWPMYVRRLFYHNCPYNDPNGCKDERKEAGDEQVNLSAPYSKGSVQGWLYAMLQKIKDEYGFFPPMKIVQRSKQKVRESEAERKATLNKISNSNVDDTLGFCHEDYESVELVLLYNQCSTICNSVRDKNNSSQSGCASPVTKCDILDSKIASYFLGKTVDELKAEQHSILNRLTEDFDLKTQERSDPWASLGAKLEFDADEKSFHLLYHCKTTHMLEILLPYIVDSTVIAVFITGQIIPDTMISAIEDRCKGFMHPEEDRVLSSSTTSNPFERNTYSRELKADNKSINISTVLEKIRIEELLYTYKEEIKRQCFCVQQRVGRNWSNFVLHATKTLKKVFQNSEGTHDKSYNADDEMKRLYHGWIPDATQLYFYEVHEKHKPSDNKLVLKWAHPENEVCATARRLPTEKLQHDMINQKGQPTSAVLLKCDNKDYPVLLSDIKEDSLFIVVYGPNRQVNHAFYIRFDKDFYKCIKDDDLVTSRLRDFYSSLGTSLSLVLSYNKAVADRQMFAAIIDMSSHEISQRTFAAQFKLETIYGYWSSVFTNASDDVRNLMGKIIEKNDPFSLSYRDLKSMHTYLSALSMIITARSFDVLTVKTRDSKKSISIYKDCVDPAVSSFRVERRKTCKDICINVMESLDDKTTIKQDDKFIISESLLLMILFNLVGNATKYAYEGTKIYLDYRKYMENNKKLYLAIKVTNYGFGIPDRDGIRDRIFDSGFRLNDQLDSSGNKYQQSTIAGNGIGLYLVKQCVELMDGIMDPIESEMVSKYSLPFLRNYDSSRIKSLLTETEKKEVVSELSAMRKSGEFEHIVHQPIGVLRVDPITGKPHKDIYNDVGGSDAEMTDRYKPPREFVKCLRRELFRTTFSLRIPIEEEKKERRI